MSEPLACTEASFRHREYSLDDDAPGPGPRASAEGATTSARECVASGPEPLVCESRQGSAKPSPPPAPPPPPAGSQLLVDKFKSRSPVATPPPNRNDAARVDQRWLDGPVARASSGPGGHDAEVALAKGTEGHTDVGVEVLGASLHAGADGMEMQVTGARLQVSPEPVGGTIEVGTARAYLGLYGDDGSRGAALGATATLVSSEVTIGEGDSITLGVGVGVGASGSVGIRDADGDGVDELCAKVSVGVATLGVCTEGIEAEGAAPTPADGTSGTGSADPAPVGAGG